MSSINGVVLIPSLNPDEKLIQYVDELILAGFKKIVVVNDGSSYEYDVYFEKLENKQECIVLKHSVNQGKGRALKTGFNYFLNNFTKEQFIGVITADADGQHSVEDTLKVAIGMEKNKNSLVLGTRVFNEETVPFKSRFGNKTTTLIFTLLYTKKINDTQTGLRGIPYDFIDDCLKLNGERFEYEINMLISAVKKDVEIIEERIQTIYYDSNRETHFDAIRDSARIYAVIFKYFLKFSFSSLASSIIDILLFAFFTKTIFSSLDIKTCVFLGTILSRVLSSLFNYLCNINLVFHEKSKFTLIKYYFLCCIQMLISWGLVTYVFYWIHIDTTAIKVVIDFLLFLISFQIQRRWVFKSRVELV